MRAILAYLDPNSGSVILQAILGAFLALGYFFRHTVAGFFRRSKHRPNATKKEALTEKVGSEQVDSE